MDLGGGPHRVAIDSAEGGGWALVLQYVHRGGTNPELDVIGPGEDWPLPSPTALGGEDSVRSPRWGHLGQTVASLLTSATELRWRGRTDAHPRVVHFSSPVGVDGWRRGVNEFSSIQAAFTPLTAHDARLPAEANNFGFETTADTVLTSFPILGRTAILSDWAVRGQGFRWAVDEVDARGDAASTIHEVWAR
jgi:hypothetical protein